MKGLRLILASTSPRRRELLSNAEIEFQVRPPSAEEILEGEPAEIVVLNAIAKARSVTADDGDLVIGSDTLVFCNGEVLGKPVDENDARRMMELQLRHPQDVITGICVLRKSDGKQITGFEVSRVEMKGDEEALRAHLESGQWRGKAGSYGIQDKGAIEIVIVHGQHDNVVGLPVTLLRRMLSLVGYEYPDHTPSSGLISKK